MMLVAQSLWIPCLTTIVLIFVLRPMARGIGLVDRPGGRKTHEGEVPIVGGLAMFAGIIVGTIGVEQPASEYHYFVAALSLLTFVGAVDDRYELPPVVRFLAQILATLFMIFGAGLYVSQLGSAFSVDHLHLGTYSVPFTILLVATAVNAFNMFDGSDGIAGAQALIGLICLGISTLVAGALPELQVIASVLGSVFGFLIFNWPSKRTKGIRAFMGDAGSTMLGFSLAWISVGLTQRPAGPTISPIAVLWIFALPIFDLFGSMLRRVLRGQSPIHADTEHFHHLLKRFGLSSRGVAHLILLASTLFASVGIGGYYLQISDGIMLLAWLTLGILYFIAFASGIVMRRREAIRPETKDDGAPGLLKQRR